MGFSSSTCYYSAEISGLRIALLIRISGAAPSLLGFIVGVSFTLLRPLVWKYDIYPNEVAMGPESRTATGVN